MRTKAKESRKHYGERQGETAVIARAKALRSVGISWDMVTQTLDAEGFNTHYEGKWIGTTINKIVRRG